MLYILILILAALVGGPLLVAALLASAGVVFVAYQVLVGICIAVFVLVGGLGFVAFRISESRRQTRHIFGPITEEFKNSHSQAFPGIWEAKGYFVFEFDKQGYRFESLEMARRRRSEMAGLARTGGHAINVKTRRPTVM